MDEGHLTNVFDLTYIKMVQFTMNCIGCWPNKELGNNSRLSKFLSIYNYCLTFLCAMAMVFEYKYLRKYTGIQDFAALGHTYITLFMGCLFIQRVTMPMQKSYCNNTKEFLTKFHLIHHKSKSEYSEKMNKLIQKICFIFSVVSHSQLYAGLFFYNFIPLYENYATGMFSGNKPINGTFAHSIFYDLPVIDQYTNWFWYITVAIFNVCLSYSVVCSFCVFNLFLCLNVFHIWGHLNILKNRLTSFQKPERAGSIESPTWYTKEESKAVHKELSEMVEYHKMITDFLKQTSSTYSVFLYVYFIFHQVSGCVLLLEVSRMNAEAFGKYGLLTLTQFQQLIQLGIVFELISTKGEEIVDDVYGLPWECMDYKNRKTILFFLQNVQKPMAIKAGDMVPVGVQTMFAIIKASCSYFVMLTTFAQEEYQTTQLLTGHRGFSWYLCRFKCKDTRRASEQDAEETVRHLILGCPVFAKDRFDVDVKDNKLVVAERRILRKILGPNVLGETKARLRWLGHVERLGEDRAVKRAYLGRPSGRRPVGRPRYRWRDKALKDLLDLGVEGWQEVAQDCNAWRNLVLEAKTHYGSLRPGIIMALAKIFEYLKVKLDDGKKDSALQCSYIIQVRLALSLITSWPHKEFGNPKLDARLSIYNLVLCLMACILPVSSVAYMWNYRNIITFVDMGHSYLTILLNCLYLQRIILARSDKYRQTIKEFLENFHLLNASNHSEYATLLYDQIDVLSKMFTIIVLTQMGCGIFLFNLMPCYNNYAKGMFSENRVPNSTFEHSVYYYSPVDDVYTAVKGYWIMFTFNIYMSVNVSCGLCAFDLFLSLIVFQIWGQLKLLKHNLQIFPLPQMQEGDNKPPLLYSTEENKYIRRLLSENILHHKYILDFTDKCSNAFSEYLFLTYTFHQVTGCVLLLEVSTLSPEALAKYGPLTVIVFQQLIQVSLVFEMVNAKSEELINAVYELPWEYMNTSNRRTVMFFLYKVQTPMSLKAMKVVPVGIQTMAGILKTSLSYFMMLTTVAAGD
ncbi:uncharacterized protein [Choristoneura fumiferana]|uniref:uncharacterized protein n=1 Tax=Choristoneura fumiferana TaxID=7141 RepID=UPI003D154FF8